MGAQPHARLGPQLTKAALRQRVSHSASIENARQPLVNHTGYGRPMPELGLSLAVAPPRRLSGFGLQTNWSLSMLLPFDLRVDREGWTVFEIATDQAASLDGLPLNGLCLEDAEDAVNALNKLEIACRRTARKMVDLPHSSGAARSGVDLALTAPHTLATAPPLDKAA